ncbi:MULTISPECIES: hypothetical protein [Idiomarina]|jgi:predicted Zn-dependent protease|uniref:hypothetical protein n=1 Tax=Idiomarina TaxID=135575 RepID=UPI0008F01ABB|nr:MULTISPECIES: hypothetical protein [Idiomarina]SFT39108.1 hypothetical protein SAMN04515657_0266 [Idiomarina abyssalis]
MKRNLTIVVFLLSLVSSGCSTTVQEKLAREQSFESAINWYQTGDLLSAEQHLHWLHKKGLGTDKSWKLLGNIYFRQYRFEASQSAYRNSLKMNAADEEVWFNLALLSLRQTTNILMDARVELDTFDGELEMLLRELLELQKARLHETPRDESA